MIPIPINFDEVEIWAIPTALYVKKIKVGIGKCLPSFWLQAGVLYQIRSGTTRGKDFSPWGLVNTFLKRIPQKLY
jgi:hypothetical protein